MSKTPEEFHLYQACNLQKSTLLDRLRQKGCRITKQREALIDVILQNECAGGDRSSEMEKRISDLL